MSEFAARVARSNKKSAAALTRSLLRVSKRNPDVPSEHFTFTFREDADPLELTAAAQRMEAYGARVDQLTFTGTLPLLEVA